MVRVSIIGCGLVGVKIAGEFAYHGHRVKIYDNNIGALNSVYAKYQADKAQLYADGCIVSPNLTGQILCLSRLEEAVNDAQLVIESVVEDLDVKCALFSKVSELCPPDAILVTNTLRLDIAKLAAQVKPNPERFAGLRFLYPVYYIAEVEFSPHKETSQVVCEKLRQLLAQMGKTLFFRSGSEPLILSEEKRESRKQQRIEELRASQGLPPIMMNNAMSVPELSVAPSASSVVSDVQRLFYRRNSSRNPDFNSINGGGSNNNYSNQTEELKPNNNKNKTKLLLIEEDDSKFGKWCEDDCVICMDKCKNSVLRPCNHMMTCIDCAVLLLNRQDNCPICRRRIEDVIKIFMA